MPDVDQPIPLSADYVPGSTYPAEICVLRYALERHARTRPDAIFAAFEGGERWTFAETLDRVVRLAGNLLELGVRQGDHVVLVLPTSPLALRAMFAINYLGAVYVPVNPALKGSLIEHVLANAGAALAVVHDSVFDRVLAAAPATLKTIVRSSDEASSQNGDVDIRGVSALTNASSPPPAPSRPIEPFDTQSIIYTSGTTGRSKGVLSSYMHAFSCVGPDAWNCLTPDDRQLLHMPIFHIGGDYRFVDRIKDAIRRRGENISSYEIEVELLSHPSIREAAAIPVPSEFSEDEVMVVLAPAAGASVEPEAIIRHLLPRVAHHMVPRYIRVIDELPKTPTTKVEKHVLRAEGVTSDTWDRESAGISIGREKI